MDLRKLKGNLGLKSSALAPTACKLSSQFLVLDHMSNHYTKIAKAKSAIDSRPPKSLVTSQKMRDRMNRHRFVESPQPRSQLSVSTTVLSEYEDVLKDEPEDEEEKLVHSIMRSTLLEKSRSSNNATYSGDQRMDAYQQMPTYTHETSPYGAVMFDHPASVRSHRSGHSATSSPSRLGIATSLLVKRTCKGDVLEKRPHLFTEPERPFTPRTLKKNTESRLKNSKCYNPPRNKSAKKENNHETDTENNNKKDALQNDETDTVKTEKGRKIKKQQSKFLSPQPQNNLAQKVNQQAEYDLEVTAGASKWSNSTLMDMSLRSRDETDNQEVVNGVPALAITVDKDHMNWLQEQASKAEIRVRSSGRLKSSLHPDKELHSVGRYRSLGESGVEPEMKMEKLRKTNETEVSQERNPASKYLKKSDVLAKRDEEQKYLAFAKEVTDDVLCRGISSDSVLDMVFENHIVRHKDDLDEGRMRKVISDLRNNLGLKDSFTRGQVSASLSDNNYNNWSKASLSDNSRSESEHTTYNRASRRDNSHMHSASDVNSTLESVSTLKFGQTGDVLSTISSEARLGGKESEKKLEEDNEMAVSQTLREYQLSLADQEDVRESARESEHSIAQEDQFKHLYRQQKPAINERRKAGEGTLQAEVSTVKDENWSSEKLSQETANIDGLLNTRNGDISSDDAISRTRLPSHDDAISQTRLDKFGNLKYGHDKMSSFEKSPASSPEASHVNNDEDSSVASSVLSQRPVARPRTRARQGSHERTQAEAAAAGDYEVVHQVQQDNVRGTTAGSFQNISPTAGGSDTIVDTDASGPGHAGGHAAGPGHTGGHAAEAAKHAVEEDDEYEDDYEEIIESENDSADDF